MFEITANQGFHITFANGWTVSVQFGRGNYCKNHRLTTPFGADVPPCPNAEIAAWDRVGHWYQFSDEYEGSQVSGHVKPDEVLAFMNIITSKPLT